MVKVLWEMYIGVSGQGGTHIGSSPLLKMNKSPTVHMEPYLKLENDYDPVAFSTGHALSYSFLLFNWTFF